MNAPFLTQGELIDAEVREHLKEQALALMEEARAAGFIIQLTMQTTRHRAMYGSNDSLVVAPDGRKGPVFLHPNPQSTGQTFKG